MSYKFKLQALLKVREFKERNLKIELGKIVQEKEETKERIAQINRDIDEGYHTQDELMHTDFTGSLLRFFPYFLEGKKADLEQTEKKLIEIDERLNKKLQELATARGETKLLENMKNNDFEKYKRDLEKKRHEKIEELFIMRQGKGEEI